MANTETTINKVFKGPGDDFSSGELAGDIAPPNLSLGVLIEKGSVLIVSYRFLFALKKVNSTGSMI